MKYEAFTGVKVRIIMKRSSLLLFTTMA